MNKSTQIAVYYFPNYHIDPRNEVIHGKNWTEWNLMKVAVPKFPGHYQPKIPLWGYEDESIPELMAKKIDAASEHGIDAFIFDWYWYDDGPFLKHALDDGFLNAPNRSKLKFAIMWANHDWVDIHPAKQNCLPRLLYPGKVTPETFEIMTDYIIENYFPRENYWLVDGCPYFSIYELPKFISGMGGVHEAAKALQRFRNKTIAAGFKDLHLNLVLYSVKILPGEESVKNKEELLQVLKADSVGSYVWVHHCRFDDFPEVSYQSFMESSIEYWDEAAKDNTLPFIPNVTMGWDPSPRTVQSDTYKLNECPGYPFSPVLTGNTPYLFGKAVRKCIDFLQDKELKILTINAWNEWTEGSYLEPDTKNKYAYLEAIKNSKGTL
jgi:Glycosyltransferase WbsX